jgi:small multidrug resistance family-3 protein
MEAMALLQSGLFFVLAALCEIGGGYLVWIWIREGKSIWLAFGGAVLLVLYGVVPTLQPANFGRVYAAYGGVFIVMSTLWGWRVDKIMPDRFDLLGGLLALVGVIVIMYAPRG